jgi:hypothetical protein
MALDGGIQHLIMALDEKDSTSNNGFRWRDSTSNNGFRWRKITISNNGFE